MNEIGTIFLFCMKICIVLLSSQPPRYPQVSPVLTKQMSSPLEGNHQYVVEYRRDYENHETYRGTDELCLSWDFDARSGQSNIL